MVCPPQNPCGRINSTHFTHSLFFEFDSKESQPIVDPGANRGRILSDATSELQRVQSVQLSLEYADPFIDGAAI